MKPKALLFLMVFIFSLVGPSQQTVSAEIYGAFPTGLLELQKKEKYYLFVPAEYTPDKPWPLVVLIGKAGEDPKKRIEEWVDWAEQKEVLVLAVPNMVPERDVPTTADEWLFGIKREIMERYNIDRFQTLLIGFDSGAHYASYVGLRYPQEFTAAALVGQAWEGPFRALMRGTKSKSRQTPFYLAMDQKEKDFGDVEKSALDLEKKGYHVTVENFESGQDFKNIRDTVYQWFRAQSEIRILAWEKPKTERWSKFWNFWDKLFEV